jgi:transcriptional regulator with XRE-family HTH domain
MRNMRTFLLMREFEAREIGQRIALARNETGGMTQEELSELVGVTSRSVQLWESGDTIPYKRLSRIAEVLGRPVGWFLHGNDDDEDDRLSRLEEQLGDATKKLPLVLALVDVGRPPLMGTAATVPILAPFG